MGDDTIDGLKHLRTLWTTGPCVQSSSVLHQRAKTRDILDAAIAEIARLKKEHERTQKENERLRAELDTLRNVAVWARNLARDVPPGSNGWADLIRGAVDN